MWNLADSKFHKVETENDLSTKITEKCLWLAPKGKRKKLEKRPNEEQRRNQKRENEKGQRPKDKEQFFKLPKRSQNCLS